jgi:hypothetical protein
MESFFKKVFSIFNNVRIKLFMFAMYKRKSSSPLTTTIIRMLLIIFSLLLLFTLNVHFMSESLDKGVALKVVTSSAQASTIDNLLTRLLNNEDKEAKLAANLDSKYSINRSPFDYFNQCDYLSMIKLKLAADNHHQLELMSSSRIKPYVEEPTSLCDITFTIKTTKSNHQSRLMDIIETWYQLVSSKVKLNKSSYQRILRN